MDLKEIMKNAIELAAKHGEAKREQALRLQEMKNAEARKQRQHEKSLTELTESGLDKRSREKLASTKSLKELTTAAKSAKGTSGGLTFAQRRQIHQDAQTYIENMRDKDTGEVLHPKSGRVLQANEIQDIYRTKAAELENIYLGGKGAGTATKKKEPMVVTGKVKFGDRELSQKDLKDIMGLSAADVVFKPDPEGNIAPSGTEPPEATPTAPDLRTVTTQPGTPPRTATTYGDLPQLAARQKRTVIKDEDQTPSNLASIRGTATKEAPEPVKTGTAREPSAAWQSLQAASLPDLMKAGISATGPLWERLKRLIHPEEETTLLNTSLADVVR